MSETQLQSDHISFNEQANVFEDRAGLPEDVADAVAQAVWSCAALIQVQNPAVVEVGAGTGEIGACISQIVAQNANSNYIGFDNSGPMLELFRTRMANDNHDEIAHNINILETDANQRWPVDDGAAQIVFGSRVFHLLELEHACNEILRIASPKGCVVVSGRVDRDGQSAKHKARKKMRQMLEEEGITPRQTPQKQAQLWEILCESGTQRLEDIHVATWDVGHRPIDSLRGWQQKQSLGGVTPPPEIRTKILNQLELWLRSSYDDPSQIVYTPETYRLECAVLNFPKE